MPFLYHCLYAGILYIKEFNSIIFNNVKRDFFINLNHFEITKDVIVLNFINKRIIKIVLNRAIIIGFIISSFKTIMKRKEIKLLGLL